MRRLFIGKKMFSVRTRNTASKRTVALQEQNSALENASVNRGESGSPLMSTTMSMLVGVLFAGAGVYLLHEEMWSQSVQLAQQITNLTNIKTKQQLHKEEMERIKREELQMLEKRTSAASEGDLSISSKKHFSFEDEIVQKFKRTWNRGFQRLAEELANGEEQRQERERELIKERVYRELESQGIPRKRVLIKEIVEVK